MPTAPPRQCPSCHGIIDSSERRCTTCWPSWRKPTRSSRTTSTTRWRRLRSAQLNAHPVCQARTCGELAEDVDHVVSIAAGGAEFDAANLQSLCRVHHREKTQREAARARSPQS